MVSFTKTGIVVYLVAVTLSFTLPTLAWLQQEILILVTCSGPALYVAIQTVSSLSSSGHHVGENDYRNAWFSFNCFSNELNP